MPDLVGVDTVQGGVVSRFGLNKFVERFRERDREIERREEAQFGAFNRGFEQFIQHPLEFTRTQVGKRITARQRNANDRDFRALDRDLTRAGVPQVNRRMARIHHGRRRFTRRSIRRIGRFNRGVRGVRGRRANVTTQLARSGMSRARVMSMSRPVFSKGAVFPKTMFTKLTNSDIIRIANVAEASKQVLSIDINSCFDMFVIPAGTKQPLYYDQIRGLYNDAVVLGARVTLQMLDYSTSTQLIIKTKTTIGNDGAEPTSIQAMEAPNTTWSTMNPQTGSKEDQQTVIVRYVNMSRMFGKPVAHETEFYEIKDAKVAQVQNRAVFNAWIQPLAGGNLPDANTLTFRITVVQWVRFSDRLQVPASLS